jgi:HD-GYP domain-containing protein (c-di-GMP phosphodiesterase class II)
MSRDLCRRIWNLIYEEIEGQTPVGKKSGGGEKVCLELGLPELGAMFGAAIDLAEGHPIGHAQRVAYIAQELSASLNLSTEEIADVTFAGLFHDVGLLRITAELSEQMGNPEAELLVGHPLGAVEDLEPMIRKGGLRRVSELLITHTVEGARILEELGASQSVATLVKGHHEHYDGHGYPAGLRGEGIPTALRALTAGDCLETAISRAGERGHTPEFVRSEVTKLAGGLLDPAVARSLVQTVQNVRFWGVFTGGQLGRSLVARLPQERLQVTYLDVARYLHHLVELVDSKSPFRHRHSWNVARHTYLVALEMGLAEDLAASLGLAGLLHDVGKAGISNQILDKPKWLTGPEYEQAKRHLDYTTRILHQAGGLFDELLGWIDLHHERLDGSGYPSRLKGDQLSREARVLATADVYDALVSDRPYRKGLELNAAIRFMEGKVNRYFDPEVLAALAAVVENTASK